MVTTYINYQTITRDLDRSIEMVKQQPVTARETEYYLENISSAKTIDDFMSNDRLYNYALKAHGLEEIAYAKALIRKALTEGIDDPNSFANQLNDKRYRELVETFNFVRHNEITTIFTAAQQGTVDKYLRQTLEQNAGADNEGVRLALYFERNAPTITNAFEILADPALAIVARTILSLPPEFAGTNIDKQAEYFEEKIDFTDFSDPEKLNKLLQRFTSLWELENPSTTVTAASLFSSSSAGISSDLMLAINNLKLGG
ncbi:DUF1217 domain-containing protein [Hoeflea prorocentri]|uniref:DUF1217 domain-containing protein n=1 Tax=Hoeflea prorocentri TaxID=1922333 RepID=A0A9X3UKA3_9HYPH|nr:DUF1217 domain-containing protein [Hoeflea prorocentri]MCY6382403.1 DUF1217 domain-containing protein [Hoeflea prorocentri]MDA5400203.1 DUF1217 domain-containing protein [Hoeflea prorocentri]